MIWKVPPLTLCEYLMGSQHEQNHQSHPHISDHSCICMYVNVLDNDISGVGTGGGEGGWPSPLYNNIALQSHTKYQ